MASVLIVEDDAVISHGMAEHLALAGFEPTVVDQGETALFEIERELRGWRSPIDRHPGLMLLGPDRPRSISERICATWLPEAEPGSKAGRGLDHARLQAATTRLRPERFASTSPTSARATMSSNRSCKAPGRMTTGFTLDSSK